MEDEENLNKENITIDDSTKEFDNNIQKLNNLKKSIEYEMTEIDKAYDKVNNETSKAFELKRDKLKKEEDDLKEKLKTEVTKIKEKLEISLTHVNNLSKMSEKIVKGIKSLENEEKNMIKTLSYVSKINKNQKEMKDLFQELMKNLKITFIEDQNTIKYEEYYFNGIPIPKDIEFKEIESTSFKVYWKIDDIITKNFDKNELKYRIEIRKENSNDKYIQYNSENNTNYLINNLEKIPENIKINRDIIIYDEKFYFFNENKKRFLLEQFLDFKKFKRNLTEKENTMNKNNREEEIKNDIINKVFNLGKNDNSFIEDDIEAKADSLFLDYLLFNKDQIKDKDYEDSFKKLKQKGNNIIRFMSVLITFYKSNENMNIPNHENFIHLSNILDYILSACVQNENIFDICFMIIYVAEKTLYVDQNNIFKKQYLCEVLSKNPNFKETKFWMNLIDRKIKITTNRKVKQEIEKKEYKDKEEEKPSGMMSGFKNYFFSNKKKDNQKLENEILSIQLYEEKLPIYAVEILEEYIHHFSSFNFDRKLYSSLIVDSSSLYKFNYKYVTYFLAKLNSNLYSIKNKILTKNDKIDELNYDKLFFNTDKKHFKKILDIKIRGLVYSLKFIDLKELPKVLSLNKAYNEALLKIVYKNILIKYHNMDLKTHIEIWKIILGYSRVKKEFNYIKILEEIKGSQPQAGAKDIITLDVKRTHFEKDKEQNREKISNILRCLSKCCPTINYSQGMNFIAAFLLNINGDEEEAFYLFLSLLLTSDYGNLFLKELENLKEYFYVFERILDILLPELYNHLKLNNIKVSFFISPWFITLFTDTYLNIENRQNPKVLMRIWDLFLFNGCKSILKVGIALLKNFENKIMTLTFEDLLKFLIAELPKSEFFQNSNYDNLMKTYYNFKIESELISNIENEYQIKKELSEEKI